MRLGKFVEHLRAAAVASDNKSGDPILKYLAVGRQLGYAFYMLFDNVAYFDQAGVKKFEGAARLAKEAYRAWLVGLMCNVLAGVYTLYNLREEKKRQAGSQDAEKAVEMKKLERYALHDTVLVSWEGMLTKVYRDQNAARLQLLSDVCDSAIPSSGLGYVNLDDGIVGLAGTVSSTIGLYAAWAKTA